MEKFYLNQQSEVGGGGREVGQVQDGCARRNRSSLGAASHALHCKFCSTPIALYVTCHQEAESCRNHQLVQKQYLCARVCVCVCEFCC